MESEIQTATCYSSTSISEDSNGSTVLDMPESRKMTKQMDWPAKQPSQVGCKIGSVEALETLNNNTNNEILIKRDPLINTRVLRAV